MSKKIIYLDDAIDALMEILDRPNHAEFLYTDEICKVLGELSSAQTEQIRTQMSLANCISRQAAIDEAYNVVIDGETFEVVQVETLMGLPPAQPEIIRCKDCKFWTHIKRTKRHWCKTDDGLYDLNTSADDFCSRAERRQDEAD